jgi:ferredoxin
MSAQRYTIAIDSGVCMGSGVCMVYAPRTFAMDSDTKSAVIDPTGDTFAAIQAAAAGCPTGAITLTVPSPDHPQSADELGSAIRWSERQ